MDRPAVSVAAALASSGVSEDEFGEIVAEALASDLRAVEAPVSELMNELLVEHSGLDEPARLEEFDSAVERRLAGLLIAREVAELLAESLSAQEAAELLGVDGSRLSHRMREGRLASFQMAGRRRYPRWQFVGSAPLPGLEEVVRAMPPLHPLDISMFMVAPAEALADRSPVHHLATGGAVRPVVELLDQLDRA